MNHERSGQGYAVAPDGTWKRKLENVCDAMRNTHGFTGDDLEDVVEIVAGLLQEAGELPPLPEPILPTILAGKWSASFTADQMHDYALEALRNVCPANTDCSANSERQSYQESDGCPTEIAVLQRFWREMADRRRVNGGSNSVPGKDVAGEPGTNNTNALSSAA